MLTAENDSRARSRRARLLTAARLPAAKSLDGYDWTAVGFPDGYGRQQLADLEFLDHAQDLILFGDVGTGKRIWPPPWPPKPASAASRPATSPPPAW
nr:ATP-binding protein [Mycolicibacterium fallax]